MSMRSTLRAFRLPWTCSRWCPSSRSSCRWSAAAGMAGTYGTKVEKYDIAMDVEKGLWEQAKAARPDFIVCDSETCRCHIAKATGLPVYHPVQVLDHVYSA